MRGGALMKNGDQVIGLFQGMFEKNTLTFNPGWDSNAQRVEGFTDIRELQRKTSWLSIPTVTRSWWISTSETR